MNLSHSHANDQTNQPSAEWALYLSLAPTRPAWEQVVTRQRHESREPQSAKHAAQGAPLRVPTLGAWEQEKREKLFHKRF